MASSSNVWYHYAVSDTAETVNRKQFTIRMSQREKQRLAILAERRGLAQATTLRVLVNEEWERLTGGPFGEAIKVQM